MVLIWVTFLSCSRAIFRRITDNAGRWSASAVGGRPLGQLRHASSIIPAIEIYQWQRENPETTRDLEESWQSALGAVSGFRVRKVDFKKI